jgi:hypothetical protein
MIDILDELFRSLLFEIPVRPGTAQDLNAQAGV